MNTTTPNTSTNTNNNKMFTSQLNRILKLRYTRFFYGPGEIPHFALTKEPIDVDLSDHGIIFASSIQHTALEIMIRPSTF